MGYTHGIQWTDESNNIIDYYIVPSRFVIKNTQISMGEHSSKYHKFKGRWDYIVSYSAYLNSLLEE